jgi:hypothetical protein
MNDMEKPTVEEWMEWAQKAAATNNIKIEYLDCVEPTDKDIALPDTTNQGEVK